MKVWLNLTFAPFTEDGMGVGETVRTPTDPYVWIGIGNPCLPDPTKAIDDEANYIRSGVIWEPSTPPPTDGIHSIEILKFSVLPGYVPDSSDPDHHQPSGVPDPTWEPAAP